MLNDRPEALVAFYESLLTEKKSVPPVPKVPEEDGSQIGVAIILGLIFLKDLFKDIIRGVYWIYVKMYHPIRTEHKHERLIECLEGNRTPIQPKKRQSFERAEEVTYASSNSAHDSD